MEAFNDNELEDSEKAYVCLYIMYEDPDSIPANDLQEALDKAKWFIDCGNQYDDNDTSASVMNWEKDENILFPAINNVARCEVRSLEYLHWWTFIGYFMEIKEGVFATVTNLRRKIAERKPLEKYEKEFYKKNRKLCDLQYSDTDKEDEVEEMARILKENQDKCQCL